MNMRFKTYDEAKAFILKGRNKLDRPINHKQCRIHLRSENLIEVRLYSTSIIQYHKTDAGTQSMSVDAWYDTQITARKIEQVSGLQIAWSHNVPILANRRYLDEEPDKEGEYPWLTAGQARYGKDHAPRYIADTQTRIRPDGSIIREESAHRRFTDHVNAESVKCMKRINERVNRATEKHREVEAGLKKDLTLLRATILLMESQRDKLLAEVGHLTDLHAESKEPYEGLTGVHNRI